MYSKIFRYIWVCMCVGCPESSFPNTILYNFYCWMPNNLSLDWLWQWKCVYLCILCLWRGATTTTHCWLICKKITDRHHLYLSVFTPHKHTCFWASEFDGKYQQMQWIWSKLAGWVETDRQRSPLVTELAGKAVQVIDILLGSHDHLEGWDELAAGCAVPRHAKQPAKTWEKSSVLKDHH